MKKEYNKSPICAPVHVSETEVAALYPDYNSNWATEEPDKLRGILFDLGLDTDEFYELQPTSQHRNRMNQVVTCCRWYGSSRIDQQWIKSGLASQDAIDKAQNSQLLNDLYRMRGLTVDAQVAMEYKDRYCKVEEQEGEE